MKCRNCNAELEKNANYCTKCGEKVIKEEDIIDVECKNIQESTNEDIDNTSLNNDDNNLSMCDQTYVDDKQILHTQEQIDDNKSLDSEGPLENKKKKNNNIVVWTIFLVIMCLLFMFFVVDIYRARRHENNEQQVQEDYKYEHKEISGKYYPNDANTNVCNLMNGGVVVASDKAIYMVNESGNIMMLNDKLSNPQQIYDGKCSNLFIVNNHLIFKDDNKEGHIFSMDLDSKKVKELISSNVFYLTNNDNMLYYQDDSDHETIHSYDLDSQKIEKLNDEESYNIQYGDQCLYYTNKAGTIKKIDLSTKEISEVLDKHVYHMIYSNGLIYYIDQKDACLYCYNETDKTTKQLNKEITREFVLTENNIFYVNAQYQVISMSTDGRNNQWVNQDVKANSIFVLKDYIIYYDLDGKLWSEMDINGESIHPIFKFSNSKYV